MILIILQYSCFYSIRVQLMEQSLSSLWLIIINTFYWRLGIIYKLIIDDQKSHIVCKIRFYSRLLFTVILVSSDLSFEHIWESDFCFL